MAVTSPLPRQQHAKSRKVTVSLTMIVRDEERNLMACLDSVRGIFDEIVVVDTGSKDRTKEIALEYGARVVEFAWIDDFAAARNVSLANATGDYAFWLDADDVIEPPERQKLEALLKALPGDQKHAYVVRCASDPDLAVKSGHIVVDHVRLFPLLESVRWTYRVHEQILPSLENLQIPLAWTDITVRHRGYAETGVKERKRQRDWNILLKELAEYPNTPFVLYNLGMVFFERKQWQAALDYLRRSFTNLREPPRNESVRRKLFSMIAWTHQLLGDLEDSLRVCDEGLAVDSEDAELWFRKAVVHRYRLETGVAEACWHRVLGLRRPQEFCSIDQGIYGHLTRRNLAIIAGERGDHAEARKHWQAVLAECPADPDALRHTEATAE